MKYIPSPTGEKFHESEKVVRGYRGPVGNGKSVACIKDLEELAREQLPNWDGHRLTRCVIIRNTSIELRSTTLATWRDWVPDEVCHIKENPWITGLYHCSLDDLTKVKMEVHFLALDRPEDAKKLLGFEPTFIFCNEARELAWDTIRRSRERIGRYPAPVNNYTDHNFTKDPPKWLIKAADDPESDLHHLTRIEDDGTYTYVGVKRLDSKGNETFDEWNQPIYEPVTRKAILMDSNPPDDQHWWAQLDLKGCLDSSKNKDIDRKRTAQIFDFFSAPPPLFKNADGTYERNPNAENISNLMGGYEYYEDMLAGNTQEHINVMVLGQYGSLFDGKPVYGEYNDSIHCPVNGVAPIDGVPICLGWDFGHTPACVAGQLVNGQMRIVGEIWSDDANTKKFARDFVKPWLQSTFAGYTIGLSIADPAGNARGEGEGKSSIGILNDDYLLKDAETGFVEKSLDMGFTTVPAPSNDPTLRISAVETFMMGMGGGEPNYLIDRSCIRLRKGKQGGYHYKRIQGVNGNWNEKPNKNHYSHISDAEQYLALGFSNRMVVDVRRYFRDEDEEYRPRKTHNLLGF